MNGGNASQILPMFLLIDFFQQLQKNFFIFVVAFDFFTFRLRQIIFSLSAFHFVLQVVQRSASHLCKKIWAAFSSFKAYRKIR